MHLNRSDWTGATGQAAEMNQRNLTFPPASLSVLQCDICKQVFPHFCVVYSSRPWCVKAFSQELLRSVNQWIVINRQTDRNIPTTTACIALEFGWDFHAPQRMPWLFLEHNAEVDICVFQWGVSFSTGWIAVKYGTNIRFPFPLRLNNSFDDLLTLGSSSSGQKV